MNEHVETVKSWVLGRVGCAYIYGATGQACTPAYRRARMDQYPEYAEKITGENYGGWFECLKHW